MEKLPRLRNRFVHKGKVISCLYNCFVHKGEIASCLHNRFVDKGEVDSCSHNRLVNKGNVQKNTIFQMLYNILCFMDVESHYLAGNHMIHQEEILQY